MAKDKEIACPECGKMLRPEQIQAHLDLHWGDRCPDRMHCPQAAERYMMLYSFAMDAHIVPQERQASL